MSETREQFRERVQKHRDAGTCYRCGKPVIDGEARDGATGSHWECRADADVDPLEESARVVKAVQRAETALNELKKVLSKRARP